MEKQPTDKPATDKPTTDKPPTHEPPTDKPPIDKPTEESNWIGPSGERWLAHVDRFEHMIRPIGHALLERAALSPGESVIDIGCGGGETTLEIARRVAPTGRVTGLDISPPLLAQASRRAEASARQLSIQFVLGDAARAEVPAAPVDRLFSRFGVMFFSEPYPAFAHLHSLLRQGGQFSFVCWGPPKENPWNAEVRSVLAEHFNLPRPVPRAPGPFAFHDPDYVRDLLGAATFRNVDIIPWQSRIPIGGPGADPNTATEFLLSAISLAKVLADAPPGLRQRARQQLADRLTAWMTPTGVRMPASVWMVTAEA